MHKLSLASLAELGWAELGWGHPKPPLVTHRVEAHDLRDGLREGVHKLGLASWVGLGWAGAIPKHSWPQMVWKLMIYVMA